MLEITICGLIVPSRLESLEVICQKDNLIGYDEAGKPVKLTRDHIVPLRAQGSNHLINCQTLCEICNNKKADTFEDMSASLFLYDLGMAKKRVAERLIDDKERNWLNRFHSRVLRQRYKAGLRGEVDLEYLKKYMQIVFRRFGIMIPPSKVQRKRYHRDHVFLEFRDFQI